MNESSRRKKTLAGQSPDGHDRASVKDRDGSTVLAAAPSHKATGESALNGDTPYFRFYADSWRARLAGFSAEAQAFILQAAAIGWSESLKKPLKLSKVRWAQACGCSIEKLAGIIVTLEGLEWIEVKDHGEALSAFIPDLASQADIVVYERDKKRKQRARAREEGQSQGRIDRGSDVGGRERPAGVRAERAPDPAEVEKGKAHLREALSKIGRLPSNGK